jgi:hypothetical protein
MNQANVPKSTSAAIAAPIMERTSLNYGDKNMCERVKTDGFGPEFETFVLNDQARRDRGEPIKPDPAMAAWCRMLAAAAEHYAEALLSGNH